MLWFFVFGACVGPDGSGEPLDVSLEPQAIDLGSVSYAASDRPSATVTVANDGGDPVAVLATVVDAGGAFAVSPASVAIPAGGSAELTVAFVDPFAWQPGEVEATLRVVATSGGVEAVRNATIGVELLCDLDGDGRDAQACLGGTDCDDADPAVWSDGPWYPDADGDGYGVGPPVTACGAPPGHLPHDGDCADLDPNRNPGVDEVCAGGVDDDCDGRVDCEDGDCFGDDACAEICDDRVDNDGDGLVDCGDEDCWDEVEPCTTVTSVVTGGSLERRFALHERVEFEPGFQRCERDIAATSVWAEVSGTTRIRPPQGPVRTCQWRVAGGRAESSFVASGPGTCDIGVWTPLVFEREGFAVDPECIFEASWFLPQDPGFLGRWYTGEATLGGAVRVESDLRETEYGVIGFQERWQTTTWTIPELEPGEPYVQFVP